MKNYLKTLFICLSLIIHVIAAAQDAALQKPDSNRLARFILNDAQIAFENNDFPTAFILTQEAIDTRKAESQWSVYTLKEELQKPNAQKIGKDIEQLLYFFKNRQDAEVVGIIEHVLYDNSYEYFDFSIDNLLDFLEQSANYPEALYLLGRLYFNEGELEIANTYFMSAYENRHLLDVNDIQFDILYSMADIYAVDENWNSFEESLLLIASEDDAYYVDGKPSPFLYSVSSALKNDMDADKFFLLFRNDFSMSLKAWNYLTYFYDEQGFDTKALETALLYTTSALERVENVLEDRDIDYEYEGLEQLFRELKLFTDIIDWARNNYFWQGFYDLARLSKEQGYEDFARGVFLALALECPEREWRVLAERALQ